MPRPIALATFLVLTMALAVGACGGTPPGGPSAVPSDPSPAGSAAPDPGTSADPGTGMVDATGTWQLTEGTLRGAPIEVPEGAEVTLTVQGTQLGGRAACNQFGADLALVGGEFRIHVTSSTMMACEEPLMTLEGIYLSALPLVTGATRDGDTLTLTGPEVELVYELLPPVPTADLYGVDWTLTTLLQGEVAVAPGGDPATLRLDAGGGLSGSTGCRSFTGRFVEAGGGITFTEYAMDQTECPPDLQAQDSHVVSVLGDGFRVAIDGDQLTVSDPGGDGLVYVAAG